MDFSFIDDIEIRPDAEIEALENKAKAEREDARKASLERHYQTESGVPIRYQSESLDTYRPTKENEGACRWLKGFVQAVKERRNSKNLLYINGKFGTGKTHLGCGMIRELGGRIMTSLELCITYDSCRDFKATETRIDFLKRICGENVLVIDEIGKGIEKIEKEVLPFIINDFYGSGRLLVIIGNGGKDDFIKIVGEASADRFEEAGVYMTLTGESKRREKNEKK